MIFLNAHFMNINTFLIRNTEFTPSGGFLVLVFRLLNRQYIKIGTNKNQNTKVKTFYVLCIQRASKSTKTEHLQYLTIAIFVFFQISTDS